MGCEMNIALYDCNHNLESTQDDQPELPIVGENLRHVGKMVADHNSKRELMALQGITHHCERKTT